MWISTYPSGPSNGWLLFVLECVIFLWPVLLQWMYMLSFHSCLPLADREERKDNRGRRQPVSNQQSLGLRPHSGCPGDDAGRKREENTCVHWVPGLCQTLCRVSESLRWGTSSHVLGVLTTLWKSWFSIKGGLSPLHRWWDWGFARLLCQWQSQDSTCLNSQPCARFLYCVLNVSLSLPPGFLILVWLHRAHSQSPTRLLNK